jgi:hypothetical protein
MKQVSLVVCGLVNTDIHVLKKIFTIGSVNAYLFYFTDSTGSGQGRNSIRDIDAGEYASFVQPYFFKQPIPFSIPAQRMIILSQKTFSHRKNNKIWRKSRWKCGTKKRSPPPLKDGKGNKMEYKADAKPGLNVNILFTFDIDKETADVRGAMIYDVIGKNIILSQTNPPIMARHIGKRISITYLTRGKQDSARYGFSGKVTGIIQDYHLSSSNTVPAINVEVQTDSETYDLRMHYRVKPRSSDASVAVYLGNEKVNLIDISIGGARFSHKKDNPAEPGSTIKLILSLDGQRFPLEARIVGAWFPVNAGKPSDLEYVRLQFLYMDNKCSRQLSGKILAIQREMLSKY